MFGPPQIPYDGQTLGVGGPRRERSGEQLDIGSVGLACAVHIWPYGLTK